MAAVKPLFLEPRHVYDACIVGRTSEPCDTWNRRTNTRVVVYDRELCLAAIMRLLDCDEEDATSHFDHNVSGTWAGEGTPTFRSLLDRN